MMNVFNILSKIGKIFWQADMGYNTTLFWIFLAVFICIYLLMWNPRSRRNFVLVGSIIFYIWSGLGALIIVAGTGIVVYVVTRMIEKVYAEFDVQKVDLTRKEQRALFNTYKKKAQRYLFSGMFLIVSLWIGVKVGKLLQFDTVESLLDMSRGLGIIVPLGISYYTLSAVGYMVDVYWRKTTPEHNFLNLFSTMIYFPHIMQGPISKYSTMIKQMKELPKANYQRVCFGLQLMVWGYIKKMIIADRLVLYTETIFYDVGSYAGSEIFIAIIFSAIQLYADFSGCMDIVRGISQVIGIDLDLNFRQPFFAKSAQEFWTRWHMTLGAWTKDYIYIPLAMTPKIMKGTRQLKEDGHEWWSSFLQAFCPLITVWVFTGLWHGTGWDYLLWGMYWCVIMTLGKELTPISDKIAHILSINTEKKFYQVWKMARTSFFFAAGRTVTVTGAWFGAAVIWKRVLLEFNLNALFSENLFTYGIDKKDFYVVIIGIILMFVVDILKECGIPIRETIGKQKLPIRWGIYYFAVMAVVIFGMYGTGFDASSFVYGAF